MHTDERIIFRTEKNPFVGGTGYLAVFPDDEANLGMVNCLPFHFVGGAAVFEPYCEASLPYYYCSTRLVHKHTEEARMCLKAVQDYYKSSFHLVEKMTKRRK